eukprot:3839949-Ditylum_brightwellii.AAC.1
MLEFQQVMQQAAGYTTNNVFHAAHPQTFKINAAADVLANLAQATKADCTTVANLTNTNTQLWANCVMTGILPYLISIQQK